MHENEGANRQTVLIVDDVPDNIALLSALLKDRYRTRAATSGQRALDIVAFSLPGRRMTTRSWV